MPANRTIVLAKDVPTMITNADVTASRFQVIGVGEVNITATVGTNPPTDFDGAIALRGGLYDGIAADQTLADLFPGVPGANRLWALANSGNTQVRISHA